MGGSGGFMNAMRQQQAQPQATPQQGYGANYQAPQATPYAPQRQVTPTPVSPMVQQQRQQMQPQMGIGYQQPGLQSMLARILGYGGGYGMPPQQQMPPQQMGMPNYGRFGGQQLNPLAYRPDMRPAQNNLGNVAVGVAEQQRRALQAQLDAANAQIAQMQTPTSLLGGGGGDSGGGG